MGNPTAVRKLTARQRAFVREYLICRNGTQAAIKAGYSKKTANEISARLLAKASLQAEIAKAENKSAAKVEMSHAELLLRFIREAETADRPCDRIRALELIGKHLGFFAADNKHEVSIIEVRQRAERIAAATGIAVERLTAKIEELEKL